jgi:hypothetical protein
MPVVTFMPWPGAIAVTKICRARTVPAWAEASLSRGLTKRAQAGLKTVPGPAAAEFATPTDETRQGNLTRR